MSPKIIGDIKGLDTLAALFKVDTNYGVWPEDVRTEGRSLIIGSRSMQYVDVKNGIPDWSALDVDRVIECTGRQQPALQHRSISTKARSMC